MKSKQTIDSEAVGTHTAPSCPTCGAAINTQAIVEAFNAPPKWHFWGSEGQRWKKCSGKQGAYEFTHFIVLINGRRSHRLAWVKAPAFDVVVQEAFL